MYVRIRNSEGLCVEVGHDGPYAPDCMDEIIKHAYALYGWALQEERTPRTTEDEQ